MRCFGKGASQECTYDSWGGGIRGITRRVISISREPVALALTINEADQTRTTLGASREKRGYVLSRRSALCDKPKRTVYLGPFARPSIFTSPSLSLSLSPSLSMAAELTSNKRVYTVTSAVLYGSGYTLTGNDLPR